MKQKPLRFRYKVYDQQAMEEDVDMKPDQADKDECALEKHRRWVYLMKKREEEKEE